MTMEINKISLFLSNRCNLDCAYCGVEKKNVSRLTPPLIRTFISWFLSQGTTSQERGMSITGGEPFLEFKLIKTAVKFFKKNNTGKNSVIDTIPTNGTLMTEDMMDFIRKEGLKVAFSIDGDKLTNSPRFFTDGRPAFETAWRNLEKFRLRMGYAPRVYMTVLPGNVHKLYDNVKFMVDRGYYDIKPDIGRLPVRWKKDKLDVLLIEFRKVLSLYLRRKLEGKPIKIYPLAFIWGNKEGSIDPRFFHCGYGDKLILHPDGHIYNCELPVSGNGYWKDFFKVGSVNGNKVVIDWKKVRKVCDFDIYKEFGLKVRNPKIAPLFKNNACLACNLNGGFIEKHEIQERLDAQIGIVELCLEFYENARQRIKSFLSDDSTKKRGILS